jgi:hypothetical protein
MTCWTASKWESFNHGIAAGASCGTHIQTVETLDRCIEKMLYMISGICKKLAVCWKFIHQIGLTSQDDAERIQVSRRSLKCSVWRINHYIFQRVYCIMLCTADETTCIQTAACTTCLALWWAPALLLEQLTAVTAMSRTFSSPDKAILHRHDVGNCHIYRIWGCEKPICPNGACLSQHVGTNCWTLLPREHCDNCS